MIDIYTAKNCPICEEVKKLLKNENIEFNEYSAGRTFEKFLGKVKELTGMNEVDFPIIVTEEIIFVGWDEEAKIETLKTIQGDSNVEKTS